MITAPTITRPDWLPASVWPFAIHTINVQGTAVAYTDTGRGPSLLFSHAGMWSFVWRDVIARLSTQFRCVAFDPPGSGLSQRVPPELQTLAAVRDTVGTLVDTLDLRDLTLVMHDLGGVTALAAVAGRADRVAGLAAINTFGWRPGGPLFRGMLALFGSAGMRGVDAWTGALPAATATRVGVGGNLDRPSRSAFRRGLDREARRTLHRLFASARRSPEIYNAAEGVLETDLRRVPLLTVFGAHSDHLGFQRQWRQWFPDATQVTVARGFHFPMAGDPARVADTLRAWHTGTVANP